MKSICGHRIWDSNGNSRCFFSHYVLHLQRTGFFSDSILHKDKKMAFTRVPKRLSFCLKEIVPYCYLNGWVPRRVGWTKSYFNNSKFIFYDFRLGLGGIRHIFMGLTICGQFLLSYKFISDEDATENNYSFTSTYKYEWVIRFLLLGHLPFD